MNNLENKMLEQEVVVHFIEGDLVNEYAEKYHIMVDDQMSESLIDLNILINLGFDGNEYEIFVRGIYLSEDILSDADSQQHTVAWGMSDVQDIDADIPLHLQDLARMAIKDVIEDILSKHKNDSV